jgi:hypothetical protein
MKEITEEARRQRCAKGAFPTIIDNNNNHGEEERGDTSLEQQQQSSTPLSSDGEAVVEAAAATKRMVTNKEADQVAGNNHSECSTEIMQCKQKQIKFKTVHGICDENSRAAKLPWLQRERDDIYHSSRIKVRLRNRGHEMSCKRKRAVTPEAGNRAVKLNGTGGPEGATTMGGKPSVESPPKKKWVSELKVHCPGSGKKSLKECSRSADHAVKVSRQEL